MRKVSLILGLIVGLIIGSCPALALPDPYNKSVPYLGQVTAVKPATVNGETGYIPYTADYLASTDVTNIASDTITALNDSVAITPNGQGALTLIVTGTWVATLTAQGSADGTNFVSINLIVPDTGAVATTTTGNGTFILPIAGFRKVRLTATAFTSGTATVVATTSKGTLPIIAAAPLTASISGTPTVDVTKIGGTTVVTAGVSGLLAVGGNIADGMAATSNPVPIAGVDGAGNTQTVLTGTDGILSSNVAQVAGNTLVTGNGVTGTGSPRVTVASDNTPFPIKIDQTTPGTTNLVQVTDGSGALNTIVDSGTITTVSTVTNLSQLGGAAVPIGAGTEAAAIRVTLPTDGTGKVTCAQATAANLNATVTDGSGALNVIVDSGTTAVTQSTASSLKDEPAGPNAHDAAALAANPLVIGGEAVNEDGTPAPNAVSAEGDTVRAIFDRSGRQYVSAQHPNSWCATESESAAVTNDVIQSAPGANLSLYVCTFIISNGATAGDYRLVEDAAGTPVIVVDKIYTAINGGAVIPLNPCKRITANKDIGVTSTTVTTGSYTVCGYIAP